MRPSLWARAKTKTGQRGSANAHRENCLRFKTEGCMVGVEGWFCSGATYNRHPALLQRGQVASLRPQIITVEFSDGHEQMSAFISENPTPAAPLSIRGACPHDCPDTCGLVTTVENGVAKVQGNPDTPHPMACCARK